MTFEPNFLSSLTLDRAFSLERLPSILWSRKRPPNLGRSFEGLPRTSDLSPKVDVSIILPLLVNFSQRSDIFRHILVKDQNIRLVYFVSGRYNCDLKMSISPEIHVLNCILDPNPRY